MARDGTPEQKLKELAREKNRRLNAMTRDLKNMTESCRLIQQQEVLEVSNQAVTNGASQHDMYVVGKRLREKHEAQFADIKRAFQKAVSVTIKDYHRLKQDMLRTI